MKFNCNVLPIIATISARKCFLPIFSNAARCAKPGALILHLYGLEEPSETK